MNQPKKNRLLVKGIVLMSIPFLGFAAPRPAAAFNLGGISDIVGEFAPYLSDVVGFDISPYESILSNSTQFVDAITSGDYGEAASAVTNVLGDYGIVSSSKVKNEAKNAATASYTEESDLGGGRFKLDAQTLQDSSEIASDAVNDAGTSDETQSAMVKSGEATGKIVQASADYSKMSGETKVSLKILRNISAQDAATATLLGQGLSEDREQNKQLKYLNATLADIRKHNNKKDRSQRKESDRAAKAGAGGAGLFAGMVSREDKTNIENYRGNP
jgi:hypothetical protein